MAIHRRRPASLLVVLSWLSLLFVVTTTIHASVAVASEDSGNADENNKVDAEVETDKNSGSDDENESGDEIEYDPHLAVLIWLKNRSKYAEETIFIEPWKDKNEDEDYQYQNGYFFAQKSLRVLTGYNGNVDLDDDSKSDSSKDENSNVRIVATRDIPKGELLLGVPDSTFVYRQEKPTYKMHHPCDVTSKLLSAKTYRYPSNGEEEERGLPALLEFVRPFIDSILAISQLPEEELVGTKNRHLWSVEQLEALKTIIGNELAPKANTLTLWGDKGNSTENQLPMVCQHPNPHNFENNKITDHFYDPTNPRADEFQRLFRATVALVVTKSWNNRMVPIYHWISRSDDDYNVLHSERKIDSDAVKERFIAWDTHVSTDCPSVYEIHAARDISEGEELILPYHSVAQKFATEGKIGRKDAEEDKPYRFWTQTLHEQLGPDNVYTTNEDEPYEAWLSWDYFPKSQTIRWISNHWDPFLEHKTLRPTQRNVLQAQYLRLRGIEKEVKALAVSNTSDTGNQAIVEYYELWVESLGVLLANSRPDREVPFSQKCVVDTDATSCLPSEEAESMLSDASSTYDHLQPHKYADPIDYNSFVASHDCGATFKQSKYEDNNTPYAHLEWSRSYIGGGAINDHYGDEEAQEADEREQDTCLWLENVIHSCLSFRPHVHETLIHYPASFLPKNGMKRVLYVGGGDLVLLHELLRYDSVELIIGMELDQVVLRNSFRHYGIQPKFEDERVHWWFGDAAKSLSLLPPEEYFGTFDMVLIDLVAEIFDLLRVGEHNERLVDYMAKFVKPEGILVRQEDWPVHNIVDFAKYTVDLNVFGMPHTCSQYFTMGSNAIDFANHDRVDHELKDLVWYEPEIESHDHTTMWAAYRNNLEPPERICKSIEKQPTHVLPSKGLLVVIEAENLTMNLRDLSLLQDTIMKTLKDVGFSAVVRHDIMVEEPASSSYMIFVFDEGYLMIRAFPSIKFASIDLQLWNEFSKQEIAISTLVGAIGGDISSDSTSTFYVTTGGMFGVSNMNEYSTPIVPSAWCEGGSIDVATADKKTNGLEIVIEKFLANFVDNNQEDYIALILYANDSALCKSQRTTNLGSFAEIISFDACPFMENGNESSLKECEDEMRVVIEEKLAQATDPTAKIRAIIIDPEAPKELGRITNKLFVKDPSSYNWLSHDFVVLAPSASNVATTGSGYSSSWRYQLLDRFRTDMLEFNPVFHATLAFRDAEASSEWSMGILSAGNPLFYGVLKDSMNAIKESSATEIEEVILVETKTGAISHIPDYKPSKWARPSDYDIKPAEEQYSQQKPIGVQILVQHEMDADIEVEVNQGDKVLMFLQEDNYWCTGIVERVSEDEFDNLYVVRSEGKGEIRRLELSDVFPFDFDDETPKTVPIPYGTPVLADGCEENVDERYFHDAQVVGVREDGWYKVYFLGDGTFMDVKPNQITTMPFGFFKSPEDAKMFDSCEGFFQLVKDKKRGNVFRREIGNGCMAVLAWPRKNGEITTLIATYDGQIHLDFNAYSSVDMFEANEEKSLVTILAERDIVDTDKIQTDFFPRGHGRVVNFRHDLEKPYFGTKYPDTLYDITDIIQ